MTSPDSNKSLLTPIDDNPTIKVVNDNYVKTKTKKNKLDYYHKYPPPYTILSISILQIIVHVAVDKETIKLLRFDPNRQWELWRFFTYMFIHCSWYHLILNVFIQSIFAWYLERAQGNVRIGSVYLMSGILGALGAACVVPDMIVGASAGVYAILISHIAHIILNIHCIKYKLYQSVCIVILVASDVAYNLGHNYTNIKPRISWAAHVVGAISGFLLGLIVYKRKDIDKTTNGIIVTKTLCICGLLLFVILIFTLILINAQVQKCTPINMKNVRYTYNC